MNHKVIMATSALVLGIIGVACTFLPVELAKHLLIDSKSSALFIQLSGAVYFGFAMVNWTGKGALIGGIYNKPISLGNFAHFAIGGITLVKAFAQMEKPSILIGIITLVYVTFAVLFGLINFRHPLPTKGS